MKRRAKRNKARKRKKAEKALQEKMNLFEKIPTECKACLKAFDKTNKDMVMSWNVVVREEEGVVRLYCPECWNAARKLVEEVHYG